MAETRSDGVCIRYDDTGSGEPALLFLPGWCGSRTVFTPLVERCSTKRRTLVLDWRGHGQSERSAVDFGYDALANDAQAVVAASGAEHVVPVALSHAGWVAIELRRRLGDRVPRLVLLDWIVLDPPSPFLGALQALQDAERWELAREQLFGMWLHGFDIPALTNYVREDMGSYGYEMWARAGREISAAYNRAGNPLQVLTALDPPVPTLHLYAQPNDPVYLAAQQAFAESHPWFAVRKLEAQSHFPMFEVPDEMAAAIEHVVA